MFAVSERVLLNSPSKMSEECLEVVQELELIMSSPRFARAENLAVLLRWLVEQALACRWHVLNEHDVARFVYGIQDHDPTTNSRIRRPMSRLRYRLREYYRHEGFRRATCFEFRDGDLPALRPLEDSQYASLPLTPSVTRIRLLPFRAGNADLSCHLLTLELELQDALVALKNVRLLGDSRAGVPHFLLSAAVAGFGDKTFVFVRTQDAAGIILQSIRSELREVRYGECVSHIMSRVDTLQINHANSRRFV